MLKFRNFNLAIRKVDCHGNFSLESHLECSHLNFSVGWWGTNVVIHFLIFDALSPFLSVKKNVHIDVKWKQGLQLIKYNHFKKYYSHLLHLLPWLLLVPDGWKKIEISYTATQIQRKYITNYWSFSCKIKSATASFGGSKCLTNV